MSPVRDESQMNHIIADMIVMLHLAFVLFAVLGGFLVFWRQWLAWLHLPAVIWAGYVELSGSVCPLTPLENRFRLRGGQEGYTNSFIEHMVGSLLYPPGLTRQMQILMGTGVVLMNLVIYGWLVYRSRHRRAVPAGK